MTYIYKYGVDIYEKDGKFYKKSDIYDTIDEITKGEYDYLLDVHQVEEHEREMNMYQAFERKCGIR